MLVRYFPPPERMTQVDSLRKTVRMVLRIPRFKLVKQSSGYTERHSGISFDGKL